MYVSRVRFCFLLNLYFYLYFKIYASYLNKINENKLKILIKYNKNMLIIN